MLAVYVPSRLVLAALVFPVWTAGTMITSRNTVSMLALASLG